MCQRRFLRLRWCRAMRFSRPFCAEPTYTYVPAGKAIRPSDPIAISWLLSTMTCSR
jgi:hypothetical protein